ncbi:MAG: dicarboxylate/amino acid:cation symporter [Neisseriaceae bacterium]
MFKLYYANQGKIILIAVILAFVLGITAPNLFKHVNFISETFINLLKLCALPIVITSLVVTIGQLPRNGQIKLIARNSILYILASEIIAISIALIIFNTINISSNINPHTLLKGAFYNGSSNTSINPNQIFNYIFTENIFSSLVKFDTLPIVIFSIMLGLTCNFNQTHAKPLLELFASIRYIFLKLLNAIMILAPLAIFALIGLNVADSYQSGALITNVYGLLKFVGLFLGALGIHFLWQLLLVLFLYRHLKFKQVIIEALPIFVTAFISSSSLATLPIALEKAKKLGANKKIVEFMLPICASMNFASGMMYEMAATLFFLQILGIHLDLMHQIFLALACIFTGIAVGGIPETSMVSFVTIFNMANIPLSAISILLPLDRILDRIRTMVNIFGNTCGTLTVSKTKIE